MKERVMTAVNKKERMMHLILLFSFTLIFCPDVYSVWSRSL